MSAHLSPTHQARAACQTLRREDEGLSSQERPRPELISSAVTLAGPFTSDTDGEWVSEAHTPHLQNLRRILYALTGLV